MVFSHDNVLEQSIDIGGSTHQSQTLTPSEEVLGYGARVAGQTGAAASCTVLLSGLVTITGLTGMTVNSAGRFLTLTGAFSSENIGTFEIAEFISSSSVKITNSNGIVPDAYNGSISWVERNAYTLEDDLNYVRTDRQLIKGTTNWYDPVSLYIRPTDTSISVPTNLTNISSKTTDAIGFITERIFYSATVATGNAKITINSTNNLKHSNSIDYTGVPVLDTTPYLNNYDACYVKILDKYTDSLLEVGSGPNAGEVIFGMTNGGSSISPDSVEIIFYSTPHGTGRSTGGNLYTWESGFTDKITLQYGYFLRLDQFQSEFLRPSIDASSASGGGGGGSGITEAQHKTLRHLIHFIESGGPADGFASGAYRETLPSANPFPTSIIWWESSAKLKKIVEKSITYNANKTPDTIGWKMYDVDGVTLIITVTDTITYSQVFELSRNRSIV